VNSLSESTRAQAIFDQRTLTRHVTQNQVTVTPLEAVGVAYADLDPTQQQLLRTVIAAYLDTLPADVGAPLLRRIEAADIGQVRFGWAGPVTPQTPQYYRLQGPTFLLEYDNSRNGGTHIHSVWRDFAEDFGRHL
jgi:Protein of unknown function (DUF3500)